MNSIAIHYNAPSNRIRYWWGLMLSGLVLFLAGCILFQYPLADYLTINAAFGLVMIVFGISQMSFSSANRDVFRYWQWQVGLSISDVAMGMLLLLSDVVSLRFMPLLMGTWFFIRGISLLGYALTLRQLLVPRWGWVLATGILTLFLALFVVYNPVFGFLNIVVWTACAFMLTGIFIIFLSFRMKQGRDDLESVIL